MLCVKAILSQNGILQCERQRHEYEDRKTPKLVAYRI